MKDFWAFRTMVTPVIIQVFFWLGVLTCISVGLVFIVFGAKYGYDRNIFKGLLILFLGPLTVRVYCEVLIIFFRINETLTEIKHTLEERRRSETAQSSGG
jgi:hypothetical protein